MPRGRPKLVKQEEVEEDSIYDLIASEIQRACDIPGCRPKFHLDETKRIVELLRSHKYLREGV